MEMEKPKLLDLFCCAGGAGAGYAQAGFDVTGVDHKPQPNYPYKFIQADAIEILKDVEFIKQFDAFHASPPCQGYSDHTGDNSEYVNHHKGKEEPKLIDPIRKLLPGSRPYVIENVLGAAKYLNNPFELTGFMFGMPMERRRFFESNIFILTPGSRFGRGHTKKFAKKNGIDYRELSITGKGRAKGCTQRWADYMQMPWARRAWELSEAIPPPYTKFIGDQLITFLKNA